MTDKKTYLIYKNLLLFSISHKCGSTSFLKYFYPNLNEGSDKINNTLHNYRIKNSINYFDSTKITIKLVRNPYTRIISSFFHFIKSGINISFIVFLKKLKIFAFNNFKNLNNDELFLNERLNELFYNIYEDKKFDHIIKLENLHNDIKNLNNKYNLNLNLKKYNLNVRKKTTSIKDFDYINTETKYYINNLPNNYEVFYNNETKLLVTEIYKKDIEFYNYIFPY